MCGIIGITSKIFRSIESVQKLNNIQYHRGPDSNGIYQDIDSNVSLAMTRLEIIDIDGGNQPFSINNDSYVIMLNGEIYNNFELRNDLEKGGFVFNTDHAEVEVLGALYVKYGEDMLQKLNGMFSFVIYDKQKRQIFIARDRYGIKPLFYYQDNNNFFFSSELKVLKECIDKNLEINDQSVVDYFNLGFVNNPNTIYKDIYQLSPGHWLKFSVNNYILEIVKWWKQSFTKNYSISRKDWPFVIREALKGAVKRWATSDVPISYLLSGGIDSAALAVLAAQMSSKRLNTYTLGFKGPEEKEWNELDVARDVAKKINSNHTEIVLEPKNLLDDLESMVYHLDQPYGGGLPSWEIFKKIDEKVVVSGIGGDEIFGNYNRGKYLLDYCEKNFVNFTGESEVDIFFKYFKDKFSIIKGVNLKDVINPEIIIDSYNPARSMFNAYNECAELDFEDRLSKISIETQITDEFLMMTDRFSMAHSLEARTPYLDHEFVELVFSMPTEIKIDYGDNKYKSTESDIDSHLPNKSYNKYDTNKYKIILRRAVEKYLPENILNHKKQGFSIPLSIWMRGPLNDLVDDLLNPSSLKKSGILNPLFYEKYVKPMLLGDNNHISIIWSSLMFQLWLNNK
jgi:asparagine synthase (glutamine-hydrolysing)